MLENLFFKNSFTIWCIPANEINTKILVDIYCYRYSFIDKKLAEIIGQMLEIKPPHLTKLKLIWGFNCQAAWSITPAIYLILFVKNLTTSLAHLLITKFCSYSMIIGQPQMKKHRILLDLLNNSIFFLPLILFTSWNIFSFIIYLTNSFD